MVIGDDECEDDIITLVRYYEVAGYGTSSALGDFDLDERGLDGPLCEYRRFGL